MTRILTLSLVALLMVSALTACGRKGSPEAPPGSTYPSPYPSR